MSRQRLIFLSFAGYNLSKGGGSRCFTLFLFSVAAAFILITVIRFISKSNKPLRAAAASAASGAAALFAANALGVGIAVNALTAGVAAVLGIPGVALMAAVKYLV